MQNTVKIIVCVLYSGNLNRELYQFLVKQKQQQPQALLYTTVLQFIMRKLPQLTLYCMELSICSHILCQFPLRISSIFLRVNQTNPSPIAFNLKITTGCWLHAV